MSKKKQIVQGLITPVSIKIHISTLYAYTNTYMLRFSPPECCIVKSSSTGSLCRNSNWRCRRTLCLTYVLANHLADTFGVWTPGSPHAGHVGQKMHDIQSGKSTRIATNKIVNWLCGVNWVFKLITYHLPQPVSHIWIWHFDYSLPCTLNDCDYECDNVKWWQCPPK